MCLGTMGVITKVWDQDGVPLALVDEVGKTETACLLGCPAAGVGARVLVHCGFVVEILCPEEADQAASLRAAANEEGLT